VEGLTPDPEREVTVQIVGDPTRFLTGLNATDSAAKQIGAQAAAIATSGIFKQLAAFQGSSLARQAAAFSTSNLGKQIAAIQGAKIAGLLQNSGAFESIRKITEGIAQGVVRSQLQGLFRAQGQVLGGISSETMRSWGEAFRNLERSKRLAMARYRRAAALIDDLPEDARFGATREVLSVLATGDGRRIAKLVRFLQRRADRDAEAGVLLRWLFSILDLLAVQAIARQVEPLLYVAARRQLHALGRREWWSRSPDRRVDPVAHRRCANAPNAASTHKSVLSVAGG